MNIPRRFLLFSLAFTVALLVRVDTASALNKVETVVLDAGHGGKDPGAQDRKKTKNEKDVNLAVALKLGKLISGGCPGVKVVYTRDRDIFLDLTERSAIANKAKADLFISLHADAHETKFSARGATTYIMGMTKNEENLKVAMRENAVMKLEDDYENRYREFNSMSAESFILTSLTQQATFDRSYKFAEIVQKHYTANTSLDDRRVRQAPYYVLWATAGPRILTEMGYMTNDDDVKYITSEKGQNEIALALFEAFREYKQDADKNNGPETAAAVETPESEPAGQAPATGFLVQLYASRSKIDTGDARFGAYRGKVIERHIDGWYKYYTGAYPTLDEAVAMRDKVRKHNGFKDAFVVALDEN